MKTYRNIHLPFTLAALILCAILCYPVYYYGGWTWIRGIGLGLIFSLFILTFSFLSIRWAFSKSMTKFYLIIMGGMLTRLVFFALALLLIHRIRPAYTLAFIASFFLFYIFFQIVEIRHINKRLLKR